MWTHIVPDATKKKPRFAFMQKACVWCESLWKWFSISMGHPTSFITYLMIVFLLLHIKLIRSDVVLFKFIHILILQIECTWKYINKFNIFCNMFKEAMKKKQILYLHLWMIVCLCKLYIYVYVPHTLLSTIRNEIIHY